jgi:hypothetical protein
MCGAVLLCGESFHQLFMDAPESQPVLEESDWEVGAM